MLRRHCPPFKYRLLGQVRHSEFVTPLQVKQVESQTKISRFRMLVELKFLLMQDPPARVLGGLQVRQLVGVPPLQVAHVE